MARPSNPQTRYFQRTLSNPQRMILLSAGEGDLSKGFETVLALYQHVHNEGFRPDMDMSSLRIESADKETALNE